MTICVDSLGDVPRTKPSILAGCGFGGIAGFTSAWACGTAPTAAAMIPCAPISMDQPIYGELGNSFEALGKATSYAGFEGGPRFDFNAPGGLTQSASTSPYAAFPGFPGTAPQAAPGVGELPLAVRSEYGTARWAEFDGTGFGGLGGPVAPAAPAPAFGAAGLGAAGFGGAAAFAGTTPAAVPAATDLGFGAASAASFGAGAQDAFCAAF